MDFVDRVNDGIFLRVVLGSESTGEPHPVSIDHELAVRNRITRFQKVADIQR